MAEVLIYGREILREFINLYRENECLWNTKSENYQNQGARLTAYTILLQKLKEADKYASIFTVKNKINSMRTCYRYELKKIKASIESGAKGDAIYQPSLWYFQDLAFLMGDEAPEVKVREDNINKLTDLRGCSRSFIKEFIHLYKKHECLWNVESSYYRNRQIKAKAYEALRLKCLEIDQNATIDLVKKKINSMRTIFLGNYKKMEKSKQSSNPDNFFQPKLFYFEDLKFLLNRNSEISFDEISGENESTNEDDRMRSSSPDDNKSNRSGSPLEYKFFENVEDLFLESQDYEVFHSPKKSNIENNVYQEKQITNYSDSEDESADISENISTNSKRKRMKSSTNRTKNREQLIEKDEFDIYAKYIASEMRTFSSEDLIFVKKLFNDTLFEAKLGNARCMRIMSIAKLQTKSDNKRN